MKQDKEISISLSQADIYATSSRQYAVKEMRSKVSNVFRELTACLSEKSREIEETLEYQIMSGTRSPQAKEYAFKMMAVISSAAKMLEGLK